MFSGALELAFNPSSRGWTSEDISSDLLLSFGEPCTLGVDRPSCPLMRKRTPLALAFRRLDQEPRDDAEEDKDVAGPGVVGDRMDDCVVKEALDSARNLVLRD